MKEDTIFASATPQGYGALSIIRISGKDCFKNLKKVFRFKNNKQTFDRIKTHQIYYGEIFDNEGVIDEALMSVFKAPKSYTQEDSVEFSFHGSPYITQRFSLALVNLGFRLAEPGEFTMRAFMNGRFDLSQAEAVADLISSHSKASHNLALKQLKGEFSKQIEKLRQELIKFLSLIELELDFGEEDVKFADRKQLLKLLSEIKKEIKSLINSFAQGNVIKQGIPVTITGRPNSGKSTLLNLLLKEDKALVSDVPGTTRDSLEDIMSVKGVSFRFIDTAGLRKTDDVIENMGIERTLQMVQKADIVLYIADLTQVDSNDIINDIEDLHVSILDFDKKKLIIVGNKIDLMNEIPSGFKKFLKTDIVFISAKRKENINILEEILVSTAQNSKIEDGFVVSNTRHYEALINTEKSLDLIEEGLKSGITTDLLTIDMRSAMFHLGSITGKITNEDILDSVFSNFCIGK